MKQSCECRFILKVIDDSGATPLQQGVIEHCPLHVASSALLTALIEAQEQLQEDSQQVWGQTLENNHEVYKKVSKALHHAEGRGEE